MHLKMLEPRYPARWRRLAHRSMTEELKPWDQFYLDTFDPNEWRTAPFHEWCLFVYALGVAFTVVYNYVDWK